MDLPENLSTADIIQVADSLGLSLAGIVAAEPHSGADLYQKWVAAGAAGEMKYLTDYRAERRNDPRSLLPSAKSIICVGMLYNGPEPRSTDFDEPGRSWISRYAWGDDYHDVFRRRIEELVARLLKRAAFDYKICVDTAPLLERSYAASAGLGWIGKNTCLINQGRGSWFFLGEILTSLELESGQPAPDRCGTCTRCIDACPTAALSSGGLDARLCISYLTIELRGSIPEELRGQMGNHVFGCDICQDVCPWNRKAPTTADPEFAPRNFAPPLDRLAKLSEAEFREMFRGTPVERARYTGFMRNVCVAMGNERSETFREPLRKLAESENAVIAEHARWGLAQIPAQISAASINAASSDEPQA
jgi:epoxyqueuosine reductase